jgi:hypothetical protein
MFKLRRKGNGMRSTVLAMLALSCVSPLVFGVPLAPCGAVVPPEEHPLAPVILDDLEGFEIWSAAGALLYQGVLQVRVARVDATDKLTFEYRIRDTQGGLNGVLTQIDTTDFSDFATDVSWREGGGTQVPNLAVRSCDGSTVGFEFNVNPVYSGTESKFVEVETDADFYTTGGTATLRLITGESVVVPTYKPVTDDTPPEVAIASPAPLACVCNPETIIGTVNDPEGLASWTLEYAAAGGGAWVIIGDGTTPVIDGILAIWNTTALSQGYYLLRLSAENLVGLTSSTTIVVWVDKVFDSFDVRFPDPGDVIGGNTCVDGTMWDHCFDSYTVEYAPPPYTDYNPVDPGNPVYYSTVINDPFAHWETTEVADGPYRLRVEATDTCDNTEVALHDVIVDNTAPVAEITAPEECGYMTGTITVIGTANDANLASWSLQYTGGDATGWVTIASGSSAVINNVLGYWNTSNLRLCAYTLRLVVADSAVLDCNHALHHWTEYTTSVIIGCEGDLDMNGMINLSDLAALLAHYGETCP